MRSVLRECTRVECGVKVGKSVAACIQTRDDVRIVCIKAQCLLVYVVCGFLCVSRPWRRSEWAGTCNTTRSEPNVHVVCAEKCCTVNAMLKWGRRRKTARFDGRQTTADIVRTVRLLLRRFDVEWTGNVDFLWYVPLLGSRSMCTIYRMWWRTWRLYVSLRFASLCVSVWRTEIHVSRFRGLAPPVFGTNLRPSLLSIAKFETCD